MYSSLYLIYLINFSVLVQSNPFSKYPFVFLLDVGNEEIENTSSEQIRISAPGGNLAIRYPAFGNSNTIAHVRVSGIDFGTELRADIIDGGPGYNYVILVFSSKPNVEYDAVVTIKSVNEAISDGTINSLISASPIEKSHVNVASAEGVHQNSLKDEESDPNNDTGDDIEIYKNSESNIAMIQQSSSNHNYEVNELDYDSDAPLNPLNRQSDNHGPILNTDKTEKQDIEDYLEETDQSNKDEAFTNDNKPIAEAYNYNKDYISDDPQDSSKTIDVVDDNLYKQYQALKPHFNFEVYPQAAVDEARRQFEREEEFEQKSAAIDTMFYDEDTDKGKVKDITNNNVDDVGAVDY